MRCARLILPAAVLLAVFSLAVPPPAHAYNNYRVKYVEADPDELNQAPPDPATAPVSLGDGLPAVSADGSRTLRGDRAGEAPDRAGQDMTPTELWRGIVGFLASLTVS